MTLTADLRLIRVVALSLVCLAAQAGFAEESLHQRIDSLIEAKIGGQPLATVADDAEFLRRTFLDLVGRIPATAEVREFLNDSAADKRERLIDRLLASDEFPRRMAELMHVLLMERRGEHPEWLTYLRTSFEQNKPWDVMVREMLSPDPTNEQTRAAAFFVSKRLEHYGQNAVEYPVLTRDVGRLFLGMDLQCAQCHDHLFIKDYKQHDFQGLYVAFLNTSLPNDVKFPAIVENLMTGKLDFQSVFKPDKFATGPRVPGFDEVAIPTFAKGEEFLEPLDKNNKNPRRPKFSPLAHVAGQITAPENKAFARNIANRTWFVLMGRGLVHPLDLHHSDNPPSHPELLDLLAREIVEHKFDLKWLLRELALTRTYQRSSFVVPPSGGSSKEQEDRLKAELRADNYLVALEKPLSAEQLFRSVLHATGHLGSSPANRDTAQTSAATHAVPAVTPSEGDKAAKTTETSKAAKPQPPEARFEPIKQKFLKAFANPPMEPEGDFAPSLRASLFLMNDADLLKLLEPQPGNLLDRLKALDSADAIAAELYLSILSRPPTADETTEVIDILQRFTDRREVALRHLAWALLASTEFCINH